MKHEYEKLIAQCDALLAILHEVRVGKKHADLTGKVDTITNKLLDERTTLKKMMEGLP